MAKKKQAPSTDSPVKAEGPDMTVTAKPKGRPKSENPKGINPILVTIRANAGYRAWLDGLADVVGDKAGVGKVDRAYLFDRAIRLLAKEVDYEKPPERK